MQTIVSVFIAFFALRLLTLYYSIRNEKRILKRGGIQYGKRNSLFLTLAHVVYYFGSLSEAYWHQTTFDKVSLVGLGIMAFAYAMLFYVVYKLRDIWTVKLYIVPNQRIERSFLFRVVRHPNYYLNIIPELIGVTLLCHAWLTCCVVFPIYVYLLVVRVRQEEQAMSGLLD